MKFKIEESGRKLFGFWIVFLAVVYILASLGRIEFLQWVAVGSGILMSLFIYGQVGTIAYFKQGKFKSFSGGDVVVIAGTIVATAVLINSTLLIPAILNNAPIWLLNIQRWTGLVTGLIVGVLALIFAFTKKPTA